MVLAAITLTGMLVALLAQGARITAAAAAIPLGGRAAALRAKSGRAGFLPQRDPDAAGRARPRAPAGCPAAA
jgi:NAD(P)H-hydrate repair Nnr-like enzyme with NAD(P)H-hydrate dehydratase domain